MKHITLKFASIFLAVCLLFSAGPRKTISATYKTDKEVILISNDELEVSVAIETSDHQTNWLVRYNKLKQTETSLLVRGLDNDGNLTLAPIENWEEQGDGWHQEISTEPTSGVLRFLSTKDLQSFELQIGHHVVESTEPFEYESFTIDVNDFMNSNEPDEDHINDLDKSNDLAVPDSSESVDEDSFEVVEGDDGETIFIVDSLEKLEAVQEEILRIANNTVNTYEDPFEYEDNELGIFPKHNTEVFIGGNNSKTTLNYNHAVKSPIATEPQSIHAFGSNRDFLNGYHYYPQATGEGVLSKKTVKPTNIPNQFEIEVDILGGDDSQSSPIDVVLIMDKSGSMKSNIDGKDPSWSQSSRWQLLQNAVRSLANQLLVPEYDVQMGMTSFGSEGQRSPWTDIAKFQGGKYFTSSANDIIGSSLYTEPIGNAGTPTFLGIESGMHVLEAARPEATKFLILLTDGVSTFSPKNQAFTGLGNASKTEFTSKTRYILNRTIYYEGNGSSGNNANIQAHTNRTNARFDLLYQNSTVKNVKYLGMSIGSQSGTDYNHMRRLLDNFGKDGVYDAATQDGVDQAFLQIQNMITQHMASFINGLLVDPMSEFVSMVADTFNTSALSLSNAGIEAVQVRNKNGTVNAMAPQYAKNIMVDQLPDENNNEIKLSSMTLGSDGTKRLGYRINYTVELKDQYLDGKFYPTNGPTRAAEEDATEAIGFAVPSVRVPYESFEFKKVGEDGLALAGAVFELSREGILMDTITSDENGILKLENLNFGNYVLKEIEAPLGFELIGEISFIVEQGPPVHNGVLSIKGLDSYKDSQGVITITNRLLDYEINILKIDNHGNAVKKVRFKLVGPGIDQEIGGSGLNSNEFKFSELRPGIYTLTETTNPDNYVTMEDVIFIIGEDGLVTIDGKIYDHTMSAVGNIISYIAVNNIKGILPSTGSSAMLGFQIAALSLVGLAVVVGTYGIYRQRRYR